MTDTKLLPCPLCGGTRIADVHIRDGRRVYCRDCSVGVSAFEPNALRKASEKWNIRPSPPTAGKVKGLEWPDGEPNTRMRSRGGLVRYSIARCGLDDRFKPGRMVYRWVAESESWSSAFHDLDEAKAAAQADYDRRIRSARVDVPAPAVGGWRDDHVQRFVEALCAEDIGDPLRASGPRLEALARSVLQYTFGSVAPPPPQDGGEVEPDECPRCGSSSPHLHPATGPEGEAETCPDAFHLAPTPQNKPEYIERVRAKREALREGGEQ